jgi:hypothetical protein
VGAADFAYLFTHDWALNGHLLRYLGGPFLLIALALASVLAIRFFRAAPLAIVSAEMLLFAIGLNSSVSSNLLFPQTPETAYVSNGLASNEGRVLCLADSRDSYQSRLMPNSAMAMGWEDISGNDPLALASYDRFMRALNLSQTGQEYPDGMGIVPNANSPAISALNLKYLIAPPQNIPTNFKQVCSGDVNIYEPIIPSQEARLIHSVQLLPNESEITRRFVRTGDPDGGKTVSIDHPLPIELPGLNPQSDKTDFVQVVSRKPGSLILKISSLSNSLLVLSEIDDPGWRVFDNGHPATRVRTDALFLSAILDNGKHEVEARYLPQSIQVGLYISLAGILAVMLLVFKEFDYRRNNALHSAPK